MGFKCGRVDTSKNKVEWCSRKATYISPPGYFTGRVINICDIHKNDLINVFKSHNEKKHFQRL